MDACLQPTPVHSCLYQNISFKSVRTLSQLLRCVEIQSDRTVHYGLSEWFEIEKEVINEACESWDSAALEPLSSSDKIIGAKCLIRLCLSSKHDR